MRSSSYLPGIRTKADSRPVYYFTPFDGKQFDPSPEKTKPPRPIPEWPEKTRPLRFSKNSPGLPQAGGLDQNVAGTQQCQSNQPANQQQSKASYEEVQFDSVRDSFSYLFFGPRPRPQCPCNPKAGGQDVETVFSRILNLIQYILWGPPPSWGRACPFTANATTSLPEILDYLFAPEPRDSGWCYYCGANGLPGCPNPSVVRGFYEGAYPPSSSGCWLDLSKFARWLMGIVAVSIFVGAAVATPTPTPTPILPSQASLNATATLNLGTMPTDTALLSLPFCPNSTTLGLNALLHILWSHKLINILFAMRLTLTYFTALAGVFALACIPIFWCVEVAYLRFFICVVLWGKTVVPCWVALKANWLGTVINPVPWLLLAMIGAGMEGVRSSVVRLVASLVLPVLARGLRVSLGCAEALWYSEFSHRVSMFMRRTRVWGFLVVGILVWPFFMAWVYAGVDLGLERRDVLPRWWMAKSVKVPVDVFNQHSLRYVGPWW